MDSTRHGQDSLSSDPEKGEKRSGGMGMGRLEASTSRTTSYNPLEGRIKRIKDVTLQDVLANRLATPLSLRDFELFLVYVPSFPSSVAPPPTSLDTRELE